MIDECNHYFCERCFYSSNKGIVIVCPITKKTLSSSIIIDKIGLLLIQSTKGKCNFCNYYGNVPQIEVHYRDYHLKRTKEDELPQFQFTEQIDPLGNYLGDNMKNINDFGDLEISKISSTPNKKKEKEIDTEINKEKDTTKFFDDACVKLDFCVDKSKVRYKELNDKVISNKLNKQISEMPFTSMIQTFFKNEDKA